MNSPGETRAAPRDMWRAAALVKAMDGAKGRSGEPSWGSMPTDFTVDPEGTANGGQPRLIALSFAGAAGRW